MSDEEVDPRFALSEEASGLLGVVSPVVRADEGSEDDQDHGDVEELNREASQLSQLEDEIERLHAQNEELTDQIEVLLGIKRRHEEEDPAQPDLHHEGKRAPTDPLLLATRTQQLQVIGDYCTDLRERCAALTEAQSESKEKLRNAKRREMSLATELEHQTMAAMHSMHGNTEEDEETVESLRAEADRLREALEAKQTNDSAQPEPCSNCDSLKQAVGSLQAQLDSALGDTRAARLRERTMSKDLALLVQQSSVTSESGLHDASAEADVQAKVDETVKKVLSASFDQMREGVIRGVLQSMAPQLNTPTPRR